VRLSIAYFAAHLPYGCRRAHQELLRCFSSYGRVSQHLPGGRYVLATSSMPSCSTVFASPYKHTKRLSCCLRFNKTRGFRFTIQAHQGCIYRSRTCRDDFLHIGAELAEMTLYKCDATLTKSRSDVSRNILCQVAQPCVSPSLISLRTYLMVADTLTKSCSDVSSPKDAFHNICLGGQICIRNIVDAKLLNRASLHRLFWGRRFIYLMFTNHTSHFVLIKMILFIAYFTWGRVIKCVSPPTISHGGE